VETMYAENDHLSREVAILRETVKVRHEFNLHTIVYIVDSYVCTCNKKEANYYVSPRNSIILKRRRAHILQELFFFIIFDVCYFLLFYFFLFFVCVFVFLCVFCVCRITKTTTTTQELELRIETQKQTLQSRDESIKKLLEMLQNKGMGEFTCTCYFLFPYLFYFIFFLCVFYGMWEKWLIT
jgi:hypothetical protein